MALHDTDPNTTNRAEPMPQASDQNPTRSSDGTTAITNKQDGSSGAYVSTRDASVKVNDGTVNRVSLGLLSDGSYGLKVSPENVDVLTADDSELIFNSSQNVFKIVLTDTVTLTRGASDDFQAVTYDHNLGYVPAMIAFLDYTGAKMPLPQTYINQTSGIVNEIIKVQDIGTSQVVFEAIAPTAGSRYGSAQTYTIRFYLLQETAN